jgi:CubicO group peptidase (beta-lactamase class C family)
MHRAVGWIGLALFLCHLTVQAHEPGCVERVVVAGTVQLDRASGVRRVGESATLDARTVFRLASVTKQFTAAAVLALVESGQLSLDARMSDLLPGMPAYTQLITVRQLLTHTAGLPDYEELMEEQARQGGRTYTRDEQIDDAAVLRLLASTQAPLFASGSRWAYSNSGYVVLGQIVAAVSGRPLGDFLAERVFAPSDLKSTQLRVPSVTLLRHRAYGHARDPRTLRWIVSDQSSTSATGGDGGVYSTLDDLARWLDLLERGESIIARHASEVFMPARLTDGGPTFWPTQPDEDNLDPGGPVAYGFGWFLDPAFGQVRRWHFGTTEGFRTAINWFPERHVSSIVLCNRMDLDARERALANARPFLAP